jgi:small subunit ribosomal protein S27e
MSKFIRIKCECGNEQNIFGNATGKVKCLVCGAELTESSGSRVRVKHGKVVKVM